MRVIANSSIEGIFNTSGGVELHCRHHSFERIKEFRANNIENPMDQIECLGLSLEKFQLVRLTKTSVFNFSVISHFENLTDLTISNSAPIIMSNVRVLANFNNYPYSTFAKMK